MRTDSAILADLDQLRDNRGLISEEEYRLAWDRLWNELREHDRRLRQAALEGKRRRQEEERRRQEEERHHQEEERHRQEEEQRKQLQAQAERRNKRLVQAQRRLERWLAQPTPRSTEALRARLEEFLRIPATNNPELRRRQALVQVRLIRLTKPLASLPAGCSDWKHRQNLTEEQRQRRRAEKSGDEAKALQIVQRYHRNVQPLYRSKYADISFGPGGQEQLTWPHRYRPGRNNYPRVWKNAGVWIDYSTRPSTIILEDYRGQVVCRLQVSLERVTFEGLEDSDLWGGRRGSRVERWAMGHAFPVVVGYG